MSYPYCNQPDDKGLTCAEANLVLVRKLEDSSQRSSKNRSAIYQCTVCQGLYKYIYAATYQTRNFDCEEGWFELCDHYFKIEEIWGTDAPFPIEEARTYGYQGEDFTWSNGRCSYYPAIPGRITCRAKDLVLVARVLGEVYDSTIQKCRRCGQLYKQVWETKARFRFNRPGESYLGKVEFPLTEARQYGYKDDQKGRHRR